MANKIVKASAASTPATGTAASLPLLVERAGGAARFAWEEFYRGRFPETEGAICETQIHVLVRDCCERFSRNRGAGFRDSAFRAGSGTVRESFSRNQALSRRLM